MQPIMQQQQQQQQQAHLYNNNNNNNNNNINHNGRGDAHERMSGKSAAPRAPPTPAAAATAPPAATTTNTTAGTVPLPLTSPLKNGNALGAPENGGQRLPNGNGAALHNGSAAAMAAANGGLNGGDGGASGRRDSAHMWTPLLANGGAHNGTNNNNTGGGGGHANGGLPNGGHHNNNNNNHINRTPMTTTTMPAAPATTMPPQALPPPNSTNNNDWKDAEEMNNLKNGLLHGNGPPPALPLTAPPPPQLTTLSNGGGQLLLQMNGKGGGGGGGGLLADKYSEQDPLTGLYKPAKKKRAGRNANNVDDDDDDDESDFEGHQKAGRGRRSGGGGANNNKSSAGGGGGMSAICTITESASGSGSASSGMGSDHHHRRRRTAAGCGLFGCRPRWARHLASTNCFMVVFLLAYILQGMYMTYFVSVITTIERLFQIKSKTTGFLLSASEMGQISTAMLLTYFAGRGHRPRWIACGMVLFSVAAFSCALPHFIFGKQLMQSSLLNSLNGGGGGGGYESSLALRVGSYEHGLSGLAEDDDGSGMGATPLSTAFLSTAMATSNLCLPGGNQSAFSTECNEDRKMQQASHSKITVIVLCIFFASLLSSGIGQTAVATLGIPYIDDNVASKQSPMYMAITIGVRILGPASGFIVGSLCTRWYVNFTQPGFDASDPRWIGAWWLGPVAIGSLMMLASIAMFSFPRQLRGKRKPTANGEAGRGGGTEGGGDGATAGAGEAEEKPKLKDFPKTVRRQLSNDILMFRTASCVFHLLPIAGLYTFLPKYLETQFRLATYDANMVAAFCGILVMGVGIVISGLVILKLKPSARSVAAWIAFTALVYSAGMFVLMFVGCSMTDFAGFTESTATAPASIEPACSAALNCTCDKENFAPICGIDNKIYISSCHAGCSATELRPSDNKTAFLHCACIPDSVNDPSVRFEATTGYCNSNCKNFITFILIFAVCVFMHSTSEVGSMLLVMRCTHPKDKAMAMGVIQSAIGLFGNVPCPIIYGAVVDSACLIWKTVCGKHGACSLYNADTFRHYFLGITSGIMFLAFIMDIVVWKKAHRIDITPEDGNEHRRHPNEDDDDDDDDDNDEDDEEDDDRHHHKAAWAAECKESMTVTGTTV